MAKAKNSTKPKNEAITLRDALPFFKRGRGKVATSWWSVTPSGNYAADLATGMAYARAFLPMMTFNAGASDLGAIVSDMAKAGRDPVNNPKDWRGIDAVALGFMMEIGGSLQASIVGMAVAAVAIEKPDSDLGPKFVEMVKSGAVLHGLNRSTPFHNPTACIIEVCAHGMGAGVQS
jgi:hypothetical protein